MSERPFRVLGLQQVAIGGLDLGPLRALWLDAFGLDKTHQFESQTENVREDVLQLGSGALAVELDLMMPMDPTVAPKVHLPALNHIGLWVDDLQAAVTWLSGKGMRFAPGGIRKGAAGHDVCFVHPKGSAESPLSGEGVLIELVQAPPDVVQAFDAAAAELRVAPRDVQP